eukprot:3586985-Pyramimonas_sp.AAC.1
MIAGFRVLAGSSAPSMPPPRSAVSSPAPALVASRPMLWTLRATVWMLREAPVGAQVEEAGERLCVQGGGGDD